MTDSLSTVFVEFIDGVRLVTEMEADKDLPWLNDIRIYFSRFIHHLVSNTPGMMSCSLSTLVLLLLLLLLLNTFKTPGGESQAQ